jgi:hypothetical protein
MAEAVARAPAYRCLAAKAQTLMSSDMPEVETRTAWLAEQPRKD